MTERWAVGGGRWALGELAAGDVVQASPACRWGPVLCIVTEVHRWGVTCYFFAPTVRAGETFGGRCELRLELGDFVRIGRAAWLSIGD